MSQEDGKAQHYLLAVALGPVQEFIAAGRKARDLWFGSELLGQAALAAAESLHTAAEVTLIFPAPSAIGRKAPVANKLLAEVVTADPQAPARFAGEAKAAAAGVLRQHWERVRRELDQHHPDALAAIDEALLGAQLDDFLEWYAAWMPFTPGLADEEASYSERRKAVELLLAGRKALRDFRPASRPAGEAHSYLDGLAKSSLDPSRESVIRRDPPPAVRRRLRLKGAEQLDGVSLVKRLAGENRLVSVSRVAVDPFIRRAAEDGETEALGRLRVHASDLRRSDLAEKFATAPERLDQYADFPFDCQLFYARSLNDVRPTLDRLDPQPLAPAEEAAATAFIAEVQGLRRQVGAGDPPSYLGVLIADGDRMGAALGALGTPDAHRRFSEKLAGFAVDAGKVVARHGGAMVYSGGDDVVAFLPLDTVLPCADALRRVFSRTMEEALAGVPDDTAPRPTLSVGIAIGHYAEHLQNLLAWGREAERAAKGPRNALAVSLRTRAGGGGSRTVVHSWEDDPVATRWWTAIDAHRLGALPDGAAYELDALRRELTGAHRRDGVAAGAMIVSEVRRILKRKRDAIGAPVNVTRISHLTKRIADLMPVESPGHAAEAIEELGRIVDELIIARRLVRAVMLGGESAFAHWEEPNDGPGVTVVRLQAQTAAQTEPEARAG